MKQRATEPSPLDRELDKAVKQLCKALLSEDQNLQVAAVVRVRQIAVPGVMDLVVRRLHTALKSKNVGRRNRAALSLQLLGPAAYHIGR
jgi:hypothetical protein